MGVEEKQLKGAFTIDIKNTNQKIPKMVYLGAIKLPNQTPH